MLSNFKDLSDKTLMPIAKTVGKLGFKPNQLTLLGLILMAGSGISKGQPLGLWCFAMRQTRLPY